MPVLICYDGSASAQRALSVAASSLDGAPMVLLNIWNPPQRVMADSFGVKESEHGPAYQGSRPSPVSAPRRSLPRARPRLSAVTSG